MRVLETVCKDIVGSLAELDRVAPNAPLLALGQTIFWDEPMKAGVAALSNRKFLAGIHDTDYFAKLPGNKGSGFKLVAHNDTTTKGLWSAAAEFSALFGSETVVTREMFLQHGLRMEKVLKGRPNILDHETEAFGWRGLVALSDQVPITAELDLESVRVPLRAAFEWAIESTLDCISEPDRVVARSRGDTLLTYFDEAANKAATLADLYERLVPQIYAFVSGEEVAIAATRTTELLKFNKQTSSSPRFDLVEMFLNPETRDIARRAYDHAVAGSEIYQLDRFMSGAIPFELVVPGHGRGTVRVANRGIVVMTPTPLFISLKQPVNSVGEFAAAIESKFGPDCTLIGKAVTLIGMLSREFVFVFHEGASSYVKRSRVFHQELAKAGHRLRFNPILRIRYAVWDALAECRTWLKLPEPLQGPFGAEEICTPSFASRWREVQTEQASLLTKLAACRRPIDLIAFLRDHSGQSWKCLSQEYEQIHDRLADLDRTIECLRSKRRALYNDLRAVRQARVLAEEQKGQHWRAAIFDKDASDQDWAERKRLTLEVEKTVHSQAATENEIRHLMSRQRDVAREPSVLKDHQRRREIELEAELKRMKLIRRAVVASAGLAASNLRPSAWWFSVLCPDGGWFAETIRTAESYLEPLE
ncbi:MAG: hypothetical protein ABL949_02810 [Fimbriimonadaceae bacterium]